MDTGTAARSAAELLDLRERYVPKAYSHQHPTFQAGADGPWILDSDGRRYLDFAGGFAVMNVGHRHPRVMAAVHDQIDRFWHSGPVMLHEGYVRLAARLATRVAPQEGAYQTLLVSSGAEAVENAVKVARHATGRAAIIAFERSFHGRTLLAATLTGKATPYKTQPATAPDVYHAPYPYPFRPPSGVDPDRLTEFCLDSLDSLVATRVRPDHVAAVIVEPVQGEGGYIVPTPGFLEGVEAFCRKIGALLIADEIQSGYGRTGRFFSFEHWGMAPDIVVVGKSIAAGLPLAATIARREVFDSVAAGDVGGTYGGNPVACAAALAVLDVFDTEPLLRRAVEIGEQTQRRLGVLAGECRAFGELRGLGAMQAVELVEDRTSRRPAPDVAKRAIARARELGVIVIRAGAFDNAIRLVVPLTIADAELDQGLEELASAIVSEGR